MSRAFETDQIHSATDRFAASSSHFESDVRRFLWVGSILLHLRKAVVRDRPVLARTNDRLGRLCKVIDYGKRKPGTCCIQWMALFRALHNHSDFRKLISESGAR